MQVSEKWLTLHHHFGTGVTWQKLSGDCGLWGRVPRICC